MYDLNDTIAAVSSVSSRDKVIIRISGPETINKVNRIFKPIVSIGPSARLISGKIKVDEELELDALVYFFTAPNSYTGENVVELHIQTNSAVTEALMRNLLGRGIRLAGPGEFTARAYLAGKIDLAQAEAVNEIIVSSNTFQLAAAEKLLSGQLAETTTKVQAELIECLSLIEAGLDFSGEDIEFINRPEAIEKLTRTKAGLEHLLQGSIRSETIVDLPAVGITGAPNAGKSSLLNKLLGEERSIVSQQHKTTRDVLTGLLTLDHCRCVLFDCAGLVAEPDDILDELAQQAAIEAIRNSAVVVFCVDVSKKDWSEDLSILDLAETQVLIPVATKSDLVSEELSASHLAELNSLFNADFLPTSAVTGVGLEQLRDRIDKKLIEPASGASKKTGIAEPVSGVALTARHKQAVTDAIENVGEAVNELMQGNDEIAAMMLRAACKTVSNIEEQHIDEQILERIFSRFCIGK